MYAIFFHGHQKIDRVARKHLAVLLGEQDTRYPSMRKILHFEGKRGPDAARLKKSGDHEQPWHFVNPFDPYDRGLAGLIQDHYSELVQALKNDNVERSAFESAWLAHALVDGLTPAHHYPYEETLEDLRGDDRHSRKGIVGRAYVKGDTPYQSVSRSLKLVGPGGLLTNHALFEAGVFTIMMPLRLKQAMPDDDQIALMQELGIVKYFRRAAKEVAAFNLYERYVQKGWTPQLTRDVRRELVVRMVSVVTLAWYTAAVQAGVAPKRRQGI